MQKAGSLLEQVFFLVGERLALVVLVILAGFVIATQGSEQAFSETKKMEDSVVVTQEDNVSWVPSTPTPTPIPTSTPTPTPTPSPTPTPVPVDPNSDEIWMKIAECESHQNWGINSGNGYLGGLQFTQGAWNSVGGSGSPHEASREEQISRGKMLQQRRGWGAWGECSRRLGLN
jgi:hypothetical protein